MERQKEKMMENPIFSFRKNVESVILGSVAGRFSGDLTFLSMILQEIHMKNRTLTTFFVFVS